MRKSRKILATILVIVLCIQIIAPGTVAIGKPPLIGDNAAMSASEGVPFDGTEETTPLLNLEQTGASPTIPDNSSEKTTSIIGEVKELRTENTKHYRHMDGTYTAAIYPEPVHYKDSAGEWKDIDNTLSLNSKKKSASGKSTYTPASSALDIRFPQDFDDNQKLTIGKDGYTVGMGVKSSNRLEMSQEAELKTTQRLSSSKAEISNNYENLDVKKVSNANQASDTKKASAKKENAEKMKLNNKVSAVNYNNIFEGADLQYVITPSKIKENIIVKSAQKSYIYEFELSLDGLVPVQQENGSIHLYENIEDENALFVIEAPYMYDANEETSFDVSMTLNGNTLTVVADPEWINDEARAFPVTIDPTLSTRSTTFYDATVGYGTPVLNYESYQYLYAGNGLLSLRRTYIKFDLPVFPDGSVVTNAELILSQKDVELGNEDLYLYAFDLTEKAPWSESTITWNNQPLSTDINGPKNDATLKKIDYSRFIVSENTEQEYVFNLTRLVKNWYEGAANNGIMISSSDEAQNSQTTLYSSEYSNSEYQPSITIEYTNNIGLESYWACETRDLGRSGTVYANPYNGSITYLHSDLSMTGNLLPINISHVYNSNTDGIYSSYYGGMYVGAKFHLNVQELLIPISSDDSMYNEGYRYKYYDADGTIHYFIEQEEESGTTKIVLEYDPTTYISCDTSYRMICYADGSKKHFYNDGRLYKIADNNNNTQIFTFDGNKITRITEPSGRFATLAYNSHGQLESITDPSGRAVSYAYSDNSATAQLSSITYADGDNTSIIYTTNNYIFRLTSTDNSFLEFNYTTLPNGQKRIYIIDSYNTQGNRFYSAQFSYTTSNISGTASGNTVVSDSLDNSKTFQYDRYGRAISITDQDEQSQYAVYGDDATDNADEFNKLLSSSDLQTISGNLLKNHGFEQNAYWTVLQSVKGGNCTYNTDEHSIGYRSSKMELPDNDGIYEAAQDFVAAGGETYTVSLDMYIPDELTFTGNNGAIFGVTYCIDDVWYSDGSRWITSTNGWERFSHTLTIPEGTVTSCHVFIELVRAKGVIYFDNVQVENSGGARYYNIVENSDFSNTPDVESGDAAGAAAYGWSRTGTQEGDGVYTDNGRNYLYMTGSPDHLKSISQIIPLNAKEGDALIIGGRAGAYATCGENDGRNFQAYAELYDGNLCFDTVTIDFNRSISQDHQTRAAVKKLTQDCDRIIYYFVYFCHLDSVSFDDAFVYLDNYGNHYEYENGLLDLSYNDEGKTTDYTYDNNNVTKITEAVSGVQQTVAEYEYDTNHNVTEATNNIGTSIEYTYNEKGQVTNQTTKFTNDNNVEKTISESFEYYQNGNYLKSHTNETGGITTYEYDNIDSNDEDVDNKITKGLLTGVTDPNGNVTTYTYDPNTDELLSTSGEAEPSVPSTTSFTYENNLPKTITRNGTTYSYVYDSQNRVTKSKIGTQTLATNVYDGEQKLLRVEYENECKYVPSYDSRDRLAGESWNDTPISEYYYNDNDRLSKVVDKVTNTSYQYDYAFYDLPLRVSGSDGTQTTYDYDRSGGLARLTFSDDNVNIYSGKYYTNEKGMPEDVVIDTFDNTVLHYNYDNFGRVESSSCGPVVRTYEYTQNGNATNNQISLITDQNEDGDYLQFYQLYYNSDGSLYSSYESFEQEIYDYVYDNLGRVVENYTNGDLYEYSYDAGGNLTSIVYNLDPLHTYTYGNTNWKDQLTAFDGKAITYDENGNPLTYDGYSYTWQRGNQLAGITGNGKNISYVYDSQGHRVQKTVNGVTTNYLYSGDLLMRQTDGTNTIDFQYDASGNIIGFIYNGVPYYYLRNLMNDVSGIVDGNGDIVAKYRYDAYGNTIIKTGTMADINPIRYRSYYFDAETNWYYLNSRYYSPEWSRFISPDSLFVAGDAINGSNMYAYCNDDPISYVDENGNAAVENDFVKVTRPIVDAVTIAGWLAPEAIVNELVKKDFGQNTNDFSCFTNSNPIFETVMPFFTNDLLFIFDCGISPILNHFESTRDWKNRVHETDKGLQYMLWPYTMAMGARLGAFFLEFFPNDDCHLSTSYSTREGQYQWQHNMGYNWYYDYFFSIGGPIKKLVYDFTKNTNGKTQYYAVWCWKGDYWNLGPGAEIGIYVQDDQKRAEHGFYDIDKNNLKVKTHMKVDHNGQVAEIQQTNWWITMFMPWEGQRINLEDLQVWQAVSFDIPVGTTDANGTPYISDYSVHDNLNLFNSFRYGDWNEDVTNGSEQHLRWGPTPPEDAGWDYLNLDGSYYGSFQFYIKF